MGELTIFPRRTYSSSVGVFTRISLTIMWVNAIIAFYTSIVDKILTNFNRLEIFMGVSTIIALLARALNKVFADSFIHCIAIAFTRKFLLRLRRTGGSDFFLFLRGGIYRRHDILQYLPFFYVRLCHLIFSLFCKLGLRKSWCLEGLVKDWVWLYLEAFAIHARIIIWKQEFADIIINYKDF